VHSHRAVFLPAGFCGRFRLYQNIVMRHSRTAKQRARYKRWADNNRDKLNAAVRRYRARRYAEDGYWRDEGKKARELKAWMLELKAKSCVDCGRHFPACCMDFDHVRGTKKYNVGCMFAHHYSRQLIEVELQKCELVCANCHRIRTQKRKLGSRRKNNAPRI